MPGNQSLRKNDPWIEGATLQNARLDDISAEVAEVLELEPREVMVVNVRGDHIALDTLRPVLKASQIVGNGREILQRVSIIPGVTIILEARSLGLHLQGFLCWVMDGWVLA